MGVAIHPRCHTRSQYDHSRIEVARAVACPVMTEFEWYVIHTKASRESAVRDRLTAWLPAVLCPTLKVKVRRWSRLVTTVAPLFPCYLFASFDAERDLSRVKYCSGVRDLLHSGEALTVVPSTIIEQLKMRCAAGPIEIPAKPLKAGDPVMVAEGAFEGFEAIFERYLSGPERAAVLLSSLSGAPIRIVLRANSLMAESAL